MATALEMQDLLRGKRKFKKKKKKRGVNLNLLDKIQVHSS